MQIRIAGTANDSIVDGPGLRFTIFTQGCPHRCAGCQNPETHSMEDGVLMDTEVLLARIMSNPLLSGVTLSGGEPFLQPAPCARIARKAQETGLDVWTYTGYTLDELLFIGSGDIRELLDCTDVLVDGRFILAEKSLEIKFRGSRNQRLIDMALTRATGTIALWNPPVW